MVREILDLKSTKKNSNGARDTSEIDQKWILMVREMLDSQSTQKKEF